MRHLVLLLSFLVLVCSDYRLNVRAEDDATSDEPAQEEEEEDNEGPPREECNGIDDDGDGLIDEDFDDSDEDGLADCVDDGCALDLAPAGLHKLHGCASEGEIGDFDDLVIEWTWTGLAAVPELNDVWSTPTIGQLTDDNGDGVIDGNDGPDIALIAFHESNENPGGGATTPPSSCWTARPEPSTGTSWT